MTNPNLTSIIVLLDESGSMGACISDSIFGFNLFLDEQIKQPGECEISLMKFSTHAEFEYKSKNIKDAPKLSKENYSPMGGTALIDAIGKALDEKGLELAALSEEQRPSKVVVVIITDGEENYSKKYTLAQIKEKIEHQTSVYSWNFTYLGANQDAFASAQMYGIAQGSTMNFMADNNGGMSRAFSAVAQYTTTVRGCLNASQVSYSDSQRFQNSI